MNWFRSVRKAAVAALGALGMLVSAGVLHGTALTVTDAILAAATAAGVYAAPNVAKAPKS